MSSICRTFLTTLADAFKNMVYKSMGRSQRLFVYMELRKRGVGILVGVKLVMLRNISI